MQRFEVTMVPAAGNYRPEIDGLRALAVLAVIVYHFSQTLLPSGFLGVDIFFVISGYVITQSLDQQRTLPLVDFLRSFYTRRAGRLLPALLVCVGVSALLICLFNPFPVISIRTGMSALIGLSNLYLWRSSRDYFAPVAELNIFTNTWSLGVEEQFYLIYPILFWVIGRRTPRIFPALIALLSTASLLLYLWLNIRHRELAFFLMPTRFWELGAGVLVYLERQMLGRAVSWLGSLPLALTLMGILCLPLPAIAWGTLATVLLTALLIDRLLAFPERPSVTRRFLSNRCLVYLGLISYSLYLWHWTVLVISRWTIGVDIQTAPYQILLIFGLAAVSYHLIEKPLRHRPWLRGRWKVGWGTILVGLGGVLGLTSLLAILTLVGERLYLGKKGGTEPVQRLSVVLARPEFANILPTAVNWERTCNMTPHLLSGNFYRPKPVVDETFIRRCIAVTPPQRRMILVGDSFASVTAPHLAAISQQHGLDFRVIYGFGCPYPLRQREIQPDTGLSCPEVNEEALRQVLIDTLREGDILALRLYLPRYLRLEHNRLPPSAIYDRALISLGDDVRRKGATLLIIGANPTPTIAQIRSLDRQWFNFRQWVAADLTQIAPYDNLETASFHQLDDHLSASFRRADHPVFFSLKPWLCSEGNQCRMTLGGTPLYNGDPHLTPAAHDLFFEPLGRVVGQMAVSR